MDIQKKSKGGTIAQAILAVMNAEKRALTSQEICQLILERNLYHFNTNDPLKMVRDALKRHAIESRVKRASPNRCFAQNGKFWTPSSDIVTTEQAKNDIEIADIDIEASIYDYIFDFENEEGI
jgi:hypothetical protein